MEKKWLEWAKELQSIAQAGIEYSKDKYDVERFQKIRDLSVEIISEYTEIDYSKVRDLFANESGYQTPKVDVRGAIFKGNEILLVKEKLDNKWSMPGGWADVGLSIKENVVKEAMEEAGAEIEPKRIIAVLDRQKHINDDFPYSIYKIFVECDFIKGKHIGNIETSEARFFRLDNLPELSAGRNTKEQVELCFKARKQNKFETIFD